MGFDRPAELQEMQRGTNTAAALEFFDASRPVEVVEVMGAWRGSGLPTGHRLDGLLEAFGWHGKRYGSADDAHPLVFDEEDGTFCVNPGLVPMGLVLQAHRLLRTPLGTRIGTTALRAMRTTKPRARLRMMEFRGAVTATMVYDQLPIHDHLRAVDEDTLVGAMDLRHTAQPFFFVLRREDA